MNVNSYVEYFFTLLGWNLSNGATSTLASSGLALLPIPIVLLTMWLKARDQGHDEGNKGLLALTWVETKIYTMLAVIALAFMPLVPLSLNTIKYDETRSQQCGRAVAKPGETAWGASFSSLDGTEAKVPLLWMVVHRVSKGVAGEMISKIPCGADLRQVQMTVDSTRLTDPYLRNEVGDFVRDCYAKAKVTLYQNKPNLTEEELKELNWIGNDFFLKNAGYYDSEYSHTPREAWPYDANRDAGLPDDRGGGFPTCDQWWSDPDSGLRARLVAAVPPTTWEQIQGAYSFRSEEEIQNAMLKVLVSPENQQLTNGSVYSGYNSLNPNAGDAAAGAGAIVGSAVGGLAYFPFLATVRQSLPNLVAYVAMVIIICIPFVLVMGAYDLKVTLIITFVLFGTFMLDFWFELARWIDTRLLDALYGAGSPHSSLNLSGLSNATGDMFISFVTGTMFLLIPALWMAAFSWAGFKIGGIAEGVGGIKQASEPSQTGTRKVVDKGV